jgi:hypothetical protein
LLVRAGEPQRELVHAVEVARQAVSTTTRSRSSTRPGLAIQDLAGARAVLQRFEADPASLEDVEVLRNYN